MKKVLDKWKEIWYIRKSCVMNGESQERSFHSFEKIEKPRKKSLTIPTRCGKIIQLTVQQSALCIL